ncbi:MULTISPECIES: acyclic terpene utilization AtuA family protein [Robiginitalea]|uniref:acyclic terpene utilization AtuA family protein n=1 Tax=Robiginitalea TaxID=252306 RepID=UPI00234B55CD|nr:MULTISPECIES: acyclic terpene utilization AtuA family protein [unclassified Robiginitalea]MDC6354796.1 DUF1446 domain-containing protein [Robiginitalea sp. PM2]MDC6375062.1 DUF1446 domain-containing protein [Robiginitalea sp. SP8]
MADKLRIGSGAGYAGDRLGPALELMRHGNLDYIGFECLAERTIALAQREKDRNPTAGYNPMLAYRMEHVLPLAHQNRIGVVSNMGAANPAGALDVAASIARQHRLRGMRLAAVTGDDVLDQIRRQPELEILETGEPLGSLSDRIVSANAYLGIGPILEALRNGAQVILTGRVADPALFLAPMVHAFGWDTRDYGLLGRGTLVGHLLECAGQISGGYFADPGKKDVPNLWDLGFPFAEVTPDGNGFIGKLDGSGGRVSTATVTEQMLYEIHDPSAYLTPDCIADFSRVRLKATGKDRVAFSDAGGMPPTDTYKVSVGYRNGYLGEGQMSYGGANCLERARQAGDLVRRWLRPYSGEIEDLRVDLIGLDSLGPAGDSAQGAAPREIRLRVAGRTPDRQLAQLIANEVEALYTNGPAAGGGASKRVEELVSVASVLLPKSAVRTQATYREI